MMQGVMCALSCAHQKHQHHQHEHHHHMQATGNQALCSWPLTRKVMSRLPMAVMRKPAVVTRARLAAAPCEKVGRPWAL